MRKLTVIVILLASITANAGLKLSAQANAYDMGENVRPSVGLSYYKPLFKHVALNSYAGTGMEPFEGKEDVTWMAAKGQLDFLVKDFMVSPGVMVKDVSGEYNSRSFMYLRVEYKLF